jgi:glycosyltransferase involved in cell wall biosynthesis
MLGVSKANPRKLGFSIIVCAFNAVQRLPRTLEHLSKLEIPISLGVELLFVDNNSTDESARVACEVWDQLGAPYGLTVLAEPNPGLSNARRRGVLNAEYDFAVFCDDDNWLESRYLIEALNIFSAHPRVGVIGGCSTPVSEAVFPAWFYTKCGSFAVGVQADADGDVTWRKFVWGAGLCFRVDLARRIYASGIEHLISDRKGSTLTSGGDSEFCAWYIFAGFRLYYSIALRFRHYIPLYRLSVGYYDSFFHNNYPTCWTVYSHYLAFRYFLFPRGAGLVYFALISLRYLMSVLSLVNSLGDLRKVLSIERKIRQLL